MKTLTISGNTRENIGKKYAKQLRRDGRVPCTLYGGKEQTFFSSEEKSFKSLVYTPDLHEVQLKIDDKQFNAIMQDIQFHPVTDRIIHIDFVELVDGKQITVHLPVRLIGTSAGVLEGGQLIQKMRRLKVRALPADIPEFIEIPIDDILIGGSTKVSDVEIEGLEFLDSDNVVIVRVKAPRELIEIEPEIDEELEEGEEGEEGVEGEEGAEGTEGGEGTDGAAKREGAPKEEGKEGSDKPKEGEGGGDSKKKG